MKYLITILLAICLIYCSNKLLEPLPGVEKPTAIELKQQTEAMFVNGLFPEGGVNLMYRWGYYIAALYHHDILEYEDVQKYCDAIDTLYLPQGRYGFYSRPEPGSRVMTRDDYLGMAFGLYYGKRINDCAQPHLDFMVAAMQDIEPEIPEEANGQLELTYDFSPEFIDILINIYKNTVINGLELTGDVWSPVHYYCFKRMAHQTSNNYWFWDMVGYYASVKPIAAKAKDDVSDKLLVMVCLKIALEESPSFWSKKSWNHIHEKVDFHFALDWYYGTFPLGQLLKGVL